MARLSLKASGRNIPANRRSLTGQVIMGDAAVPFESSLERDFLVLLDFNQNVTDVIAQPFRIEYRDRTGQDRHYTPDFLVNYEVGKPELYEVKYRSNLKESWPKLRERFRAAVRYARQNDMRFLIITDQEIRGSYLANITFLRRYLDRNSDAIIENHLVRTLAKMGECTPEQLLAAAYASLPNRIGAVAYLWRLLAIQRVQADLYYPLTMATPIWVVRGEGIR